LVFVSWWTVVIALIYLIALLSRTMTKVTSIGGTSLSLSITYVQYNILNPPQAHVHPISPLPPWPHSVSPNHIPNSIDRLGQSNYTSHPYNSWIFWLAGTAALTASLDDSRDCSTQEVVYCNQLVAAQAFGWINLGVVSAIAIMVFVLGVNLIRRAGAGWGDSFTPK
jgi:hypothetical protein